MTIDSDYILAEHVCEILECTKDTLKVQKGLEFIPPTYRPYRAYRSGRHPFYYKRAEVVLMKALLDHLGIGLHRRSGKFMRDQIILYNMKMNKINNCMKYISENNLSHVSLNELLEDNFINKILEGE